MREKSATLVTGGRVLDLAGDTDHPPLADVLIEKGRVVAVGPEATQQASLMPDVETVDAGNCLLIPGLVNAHYHSHDVLLRGAFEQIPMDIWGFYSLPGNYSRRTEEDVALRTILGAAECLCNGITTVQDMVTIVGPDRPHVDAILSAYESVGIRAVLALQIADRAAVEAVPFWNEMPGHVQERLPRAADVGASRAMIEAFAAAGGGRRLTWALAPSAPQRCSDELLAWTAAMADRYGLQVFTHLYEARSQIVLARMAYEGSLVRHLERLGLLGPRLTIAHGVWIDDEEVRRFGAAGANLACNPLSNMKLLNGFAPVVAYERAGAGIALGCDNCSGNDAQNMFQSMKMFALIWGFQTKAGESGAARRAFEAATLGGARALGLEGEVGAVRPGYRADMVFLDLASPTFRPLNSALRQIVYAESGSSVRKVMVEGEIAVEDGVLKTFRDADLKARSEAAKARIAAEMAVVAKRNEEMLPHLLAAHEKAESFPLEFDRRNIRGDCH